MKTGFKTIFFILSGIIFSSLFIGTADASIYLDKEVYTWTDKVHITVIERGLTADTSFIRAHTSDHDLRSYKLSKSGNGLYTGEIILTGFLHDVNGDGKFDTNPKTSGDSSANAFLETNRDGGLTISLEFADGTVISKSAKISWNKGSIVFDMPNYFPNESAKIKVTDADMNLNPETFDTIQVHVFSDSDKAGILANAIETQDESGLFETTIYFADDGSSSGTRLFATPGDTIYAQYDDYTLPKPYGINDDLEITAESSFHADTVSRSTSDDIVPDESFEEITSEFSSDVKLEWGQGNYRMINGTDTAKLIVTDYNKNQNSTFSEKVNVFVYSDSFPEGITLELYETEKTSGIFERSFSLSESRSAPSILHVRNGDTAIAVYSDDPIPSDYLYNPVGLTATVLIGSTGPPLERAPASNAKIVDLYENSIYDPAVGEQVQIISDVANGMNREQKFVYLVSIQDAKGATVYLAWIDGTLNPESSFSPSASWIPQKEGTYVATMFVWESIDNPTALSPPISIEFTVIPEGMQELRYSNEKNYDEMFLFILHQKDFKQYLNEELGKVHFYKIYDKEELLQLPRLNLLVNMTSGFVDIPVPKLALRITDDQIMQYDSFFTQKCIEQRPYANMDACTFTDYAFEYDEQWYFAYPKLAPHNSAIEDSRFDKDLDYFTRQ